MCGLSLVPSRSRKKIDAITVRRPVHRDAGDPVAHVALVELFCRSTTLATPSTHGHGTYEELHGHAQLAGLLRDDTWLATRPSIPRSRDFLLWVRRQFRTLDGMSCDWAGVQVISGVMGWAGLVWPRMRFSDASSPLGSQTGGRAQTTEVDPKVVAPVCLARNRLLGWEGQPVDDDQVPLSMEWRGV